jgi:multiple sugar transport system substrate-binding protein
MKLRSVLAPTAVLALALTGCAAGSTPANTPDGPVTITFMSWLKNSEAVVDAFNASQDAIRVEFQTTPSATDNYATLANAVKAGTAPDVATSEFSYLPDLVTQGLLQPLGEQATAQVKADYPDAALSLVTLGDQTWGYPLDLASLVLYYRSDLFEANGLEVPGTWEEYATVAQSIKDVDPASRIGASTSLNQGLIASLNWQAGAQWYGTKDEEWVVDIDSDVTAEVAAVQEALVAADLVWNDEADVLNQKQAAGQTWTVLAGSWNGAYLPSSYADQSGLWRVAMPPSFDGSPQSAGNGGAVFAVTADSKQKAAAETFIAWMADSEEGIAARVDGGGSSVLPANPALIPVAKSAFQTDYFGGQDIYAVAEEAAAAIPAGWQWGPAQAVQDRAFIEMIAEVRAGTAAYADIFSVVQDDVIASMTTRGIAVASAP